MSLRALPAVMAGDDLRSLDFGMPAVVLLDATVMQATMPVPSRGSSLNLKYGPSTRAIDDATYQLAVPVFSNVGLRPYSPCNLRATGHANGDITLSWIRRSRDLRADDWAPADVPLGEETENYHLTIWNGVAAVRAVDTAVPEFLYTAAMQAADFGAPLSAVDFEVAQISLGYGIGSSRRGVMSVNRIQP